MTIYMYDELDSTGDVSDELTIYAFRNKKEGLYVGYDGYDTDFQRGMSAFIREQELTNEYNQKLYTVTHAVISDMLIKRADHAKQWDQLGGFDNLDIIKLHLVVSGSIYTPIDLLNLIHNEDLDDTGEYEQYLLSFNND